MRIHTPRWQRIVWNRTMGAAMIVDGVCLIITGWSPGLDLRFAAWEINAAMREKKYVYVDPSKTNLTTHYGERSQNPTK